MAGLDPENWAGLRDLGHRMLDDLFDQAEMRARAPADIPVWRPMPNDLREAVRTGLPRAGEELAAVYDRYRELVVPYATGNTHPGFMGWVQGGGTSVGMLAEMLAAGMNANCGGRDHAPIEIERTVIRWAAEMVGFPEESSGCLVTGSSIANFIAVVVASRRVDLSIRRAGIGGRGLVGYAASTAHGCVPRAFDMAGLGSDAVRIVPVDGAHRMRVDVLREMIARDRAEGLVPFMVVGTAGTVDCAAVDDLRAISDVAREAGLWFHVDGAFGALACLSDRYRPLLKGIERADSLAFDFHKWAQVPYDCGCIVVRDASVHAAAFAQSLDYLAREDRGLAGNAPWFCDFGPDLSRGFRALKVWMTLSHYGANGLAEVVESCCKVAGYLAGRIERDRRLELLAPVALNIVCFGVRGVSDSGISEIVNDVQESGIAAPSTTRMGGRLAIRAAIVNHRTTNEDVDRMLDAVLALSALGPAA